jgi:hypothetical protein
VGLSRCLRSFLGVSSLKWVKNWVSMEKKPRTPVFLATLIVEIWVNPTTHRLFYFFLRKIEADDFSF